MMYKYLNWFIKLALFVLMIVLLDVMSGFVIKALDNKTDKLNPEANKIRFLLNAVSDDVLIIGSSEVEFSYRPDILMDSLGMTVYNCGRNGQRLLYETALVNSVIDRYSPSLIVWSVSPDYLVLKNSDEDCLSDFKPFYRENKYFRRVLNRRSWTEKYKMLSWFYTYNSMLTPGMVQNAFRKSNVDYHRGYRVIDKSKTPPVFQESFWIDSSNEYYISLFDETLENLNEKSIQVVFVFSPSYTYGNYSNLKSYNELCKMIDEHNYLLIEDFYHEPCLMHECFFRDYAHLNERGVELYTQMLGHRLKSFCFNN